MNDTFFLSPRPFPSLYPFPLLLAHFLYVGTENCRFLGPRQNVPVLSLLPALFFFIVCHHLAGASGCH